MQSDSHNVEVFNNFVSHSYLMSVFFVQVVQMLADLSAC